MLSFLGKNHRKARLKARNSKWLFGGLFTRFYNPFFDFLPKITFSLHTRTCRYIWHTCVHIHGCMCVYTCYVVYTEMHPLPVCMHTHVDITCAQCACMHLGHFRSLHIHRCARVHVHIRAPCACVIHTCLCMYVCMHMQVYTCSLCTHVYTCLGTCVYTS